jgi:hypothetical protein
LDTQNARLAGESLSVFLEEKRARSLPQGGLAGQTFGEA